MAMNKMTTNKSLVQRKKKQSLVLDEETNKTWIKQSNYITNMIGNYNVLQLRALVILVEGMQEAINGSIDHRETQQLSLFQNEIDKFGKLSIIVPMKNFGVKAYRYPELKDALKSFSEIPVEFKVDSPYAGKNATKYTHLLDVTIPEKYQKSVEFSIDKEVAERFLNIQSGFTKFLKEVVMTLDSPYTIKFYYMCCSWLAKGGWTMKYEELRKWLCIGEKYANFKDLNRRILKPTQQTLNERANCWFEYKPVFVGDEKTPKQINFKIIRRAMTVDEEEYFNKMISRLRDNMFKYFQIEDKQFSKIVPLLTLYNIEKAANKFSELFSYIYVNRPDEIKNKKEYVMAAMMDYLEPRF